MKNKTFLLIVILFSLVINRNISASGAFPSLGESINSSSSKSAYNSEDYGEQSHLSSYGVFPSIDEADSYYGDDNNVQDSNDKAAKRYCEQHGGSWVDGTCLVNMSHNSSSFMNGDCSFPDQQCFNGSNSSQRYSGAECLPGQGCSNNYNSVNDKYACINNFYELGGLNNYYNCLNSRSYECDYKIVYRLNTVKQIIKREIENRKGTVDDYFTPFPSSKIYDRNTVDAIIEKKLEKCRKDPKSCGIEAIPIIKEKTNIYKVSKKIAGKVLPIKGFFIRYGNQQYDWILITPSYNVYKLEKGIKEDYSLRWNLIHSQYYPIFQKIEINNTKVYFGSMIEEECLPGDNCH